MADESGVDLAAMSLDEIINQRQKEKRRQGGDGGGAGRRGRISGGSGRGSDGVRSKTISKPKNKWGNDKFNEIYKEGRAMLSARSTGGGGGGGKAICRLSNIPFNVTEDEVNELFAEYRNLRVTLNHDGRGRSLGTAELVGPVGTIDRLAREYRNVEIDGRPLGITVVTEGAIKTSPRVERRDAPPPRRAANGRRAGDGGGGPAKRAKREPTKKMTAEELDQELDDYMKNKDAE